jgi:hypothetical protein
MTNFFTQTGSVPNRYGYPFTGSSSSPAISNACTDVASMGHPRLVPAHYGHAAKMSSLDRKFWEFCKWFAKSAVRELCKLMRFNWLPDIKNWCPGRTVLADTNLWLKDFAQMHSSVGVAAAIQSLAGIYIYDYLQVDNIRERINNRFAVAEERFTELLRDPTTTCNEPRANELITIAVLLSMQDVSFVALFFIMNFLKGRTV